MGLIKSLASVFEKETGAPEKLPARNEPCWCGSGKKYKKCHLAEDEKKLSRGCGVNCGPT